MVCTKVRLYLRRGPLIEGGGGRRYNKKMTYASIYHSFCKKHCIFPFGGMLAVSSALVIRSLFFILYSLFFVLCSLLCVLCSVFCVLCSLDYVPDKQRQLRLSFLLCFVHCPGIGCRLNHPKTDSNITPNYTLTQGSPKHHPRIAQG